MHKGEYGVDFVFLPKCCGIIRTGSVDKCVNRAVDLSLCFFAQPSIDKEVLRMEETLERHAGDVSAHNLKSHHFIPRVMSGQVPP